jgi:signal transduction histidine kinase
MRARPALTGGRERSGRDYCRHDRLADRVSAASVCLVCATLAALASLHLRQRRFMVLVAQASHELRGPLLAARLGLHGLAADAAEARVAAIDLELRRAALALDDLAAAPRGRRAGERVDTVELGGLLSEAASAWRDLATARGAELGLEPPDAPVLVRADRLRLAQACGNLVANAIEHGGGSVQVRARVMRARAAVPGAPAAESDLGAALARIEVTDTGPGLPAPVADLIAAARGRRARRGHGLAIAAGIAERHGGRLTSAPSARGARLVLELPCAAAAPLGRGRRQR